MPTHNRTISDSYIDGDVLPVQDIIPTISNDAFVEPVLKAIEAAVRSGDVNAARVAAGRVYRHKSELVPESFGSNHRSKYRSEGDDFYLQLTVAVPNWASAPVREAIGVVEDLSKERAIAEAKARLSEVETRVAAAQGEQARLQDEINRLESL